MFNFYHELSSQYHTFEKSKCLDLLLFDVMKPFYVLALEWPPRLDSWEDDIF